VQHDASYPREEPGAGNLHARICEGESRMAELLDHSRAATARPLSVKTTAVFTRYPRLRLIALRHSPVRSIYWPSCTEGWLCQGIEHDSAPTGGFGPPSCRAEFRYSQYGGNNGVSVPLTGVPVVPSAALNSQKATEFVSTELVWRFNWFGGRY
jgi:hypothetical protein